MRYPNTDNVNIHIYTTYMNVPNKYNASYNIYTRICMKFKGPKIVFMMKPLLFHIKIRVLD